MIRTQQQYSHFSKLGNAWAALKLQNEKPRPLVVEMGGHSGEIFQLDKNITVDT